MSLIVADNLIRDYGVGQASVRALSGAGFTVEAGEFVAIMGPSGSGKSTLLAVLGALLTPSSGLYEVDGMDIYSLSSDQRADFRREYLGFVFQNFNLVPYLTLAENVMLPLAAKRIGSAEKRAMAVTALERVGLGGKMDRLPSQVSGGEQERAAMARAVVNSPPILLADEPTGNLDETTGREVMRLLGDLNRDGMTIMMVTHSAQCAAHAERLLVMRDGGLKEEPAGVSAMLCAPDAPPADPDLLMGQGLVMGA